MDEKGVRNDLRREDKKEKEEERKHDDDVLLLSFLFSFIHKRFLH